jgi:hypothetical protein
VAWSYGNSDAVFIGRVISVRDTALGAGGCKGSYAAKVARLVVTHSWSGPRVGSVATVVSGHGGGDCGYAFEGTSHLIYCYPFDGRIWTTNVCTRSRPMPSAVADSLALSMLPSNKNK